MPTYNQAEYLSDTTESIVSQVYPNLEHIIIDGGSADGSADVIKQYEGHLAYWVGEKDSGQPEAIVKGFRRRTGEVFAWVNGDDVLFPGCLRAISACYLASQRPHVVHADTAYIDSDGMITHLVRIPRQNRFFFFRGIWYVTSPVVFFKSSFFARVGGLNGCYHQAMNLDLWARMIEAGAHVAYVPRYLRASRWHEQSRSFLHLIAQPKKGEDSEVTEIFKVHLPRSSPTSRRIWSHIYKIYRMFKLHYIAACMERRALNQTRYWRDATELLA